MTAPASYAAQVGARLRQAREARGLSLGGVERESGGKWTAGRLGHYERGARALTVETVAGLAGFYGISVAGLLPGAEPPLVTAAFTAITGAAAGAARRQILDRAFRELGDGETYRALAAIVTLTAITGKPS